MVHMLTALSNKSGSMTMPLSSRIFSAGGVTGPLAASAMIFACHNRQSGLLIYKAVWYSSNDQNPNRYMHGLIYAIGEIK